MKSRFLTLGAAALVLSPKTAQAQVLIRSALDSDFLTPLIKPSEGQNFETWASYRLGVSTWRRQGVTDLYIERLAGAQVYVPFGHVWSLTTRYESADASGRWNESATDNGQGSLAAGTFGVTLARPLGARTRVSLSMTNETDRGTVDSTLIGSSVPVLGNNPSISEQAGRLEIPIEVTQTLSPRDEATLRFAPYRTSGQLAADQSLTAERLSIPLDAGGTLWRLSARHRSGKRLFEIEAAQDSGDGSGEMALNGQALGPSHFALHSQTLGLAAGQDFGRRGNLRLHFENVYSNDVLSAFLPNPNLLGYTLPPAAIADASATFVARRTEVGASWSLAGPSTESTLYYRQVLLPAGVTGSYVGRDFLFNVSSQASTNYDRVDLGILGLGRTWRIGGISTTLALEQVIPYSIHRAGQSTSVSTGGSSSGSRSIGGTAVSFAVKIPF